MTARRFASWSVAALLALVACTARADTPIALFKSFAGNVNFVGTQKTMRTKSNSQDPCAAASANAQLTATLSGIPASATILSAQLYWAASSSNPDYTITFEGASVTAPAARQYQSPTIGYDYFGGAADVTAQVTLKRNGDYTFKGLNVNTGNPYCAVEGVIGGFSLLVIYADASQPFRVLNLYEGFQYIRYSGITLNLSNFKIPTPLGGATGRLGHITWEGDATLGANGEDLMFNGTEMTDNLNPAQNQFNSASNINNDPASHGIDFDAYTVGSPVIAAGQTTASTRYQSGQDLVLLNAEIIAVPNVPVADLGITIQRSGPLTSQVNTSYTLTVTNNGPNTENGPITVTDVLPAGLAYVSASGSGWGCGASGQTVTCTYAGTLAVNVSLSPITLTASVTANSGSTITNSAGVGGQMFDNIAGNNTASDTGTVAAAPLYVLTNQVCAVGLGMADPAQPCKTFGSAPTVAGTPASVFITAVVNGLVATPAAVTRQMTFALSCINPTTGAGVNATLAGTALPACVANGAAPTTWSANVSVTFSGTAPSSAALAFNYNDAGKVQLYLRDPANNVVPGLAFVSRPASLGLSAIKQGVTSNPATLSPIGPVFVRAGTAFSMTASALTSTNVVTPNFGRETMPETFTLSLPAAIVDPTKQGSPPYAELANLPAFGGSFGAISGGSATGSTFTWDEVGIVMVAPALASGNYLGSGNIAGTLSTIGRFIPDHFDTLTTGSMACVPNMGCAPTVPWAAYSGQPFTVNVQAHSASNALIRNFAGVFARAVTLGAYSQLGGGTANPPATPAGASLSTTSVASATFTAGTAGPPVIPTGSVTTPAYNVLNPFSNGAPNALNWTPPTTIYLRADAQEPNGGGAPIAVSSNRAAASVEGAMRIVSGRLLVINTYGALRLRLPVPIEAQYWSTASRWETSSTDGQILLPSSVVGFDACTGSLAISVTSTACSAALTVETGPASMTLVGGRGTIVLKAPGVSLPGYGSARINAGPAWLPTTVGRVSFGFFNKSKLIYVREMY